MNKKWAMQIGAGNIGRGLNAYLLRKNNYNITFVDLDTKIISHLNKNDSYYINEIDNNNKKIEITNFDAVHTKDHKLILRHINKYSLFMISVGFNNLMHLRLLFQAIIKQLYHNHNFQQVNIVAIENGINASSHLQMMILPTLTTKEQTFVDKYINFVNCTVDKIVPSVQNDAPNVNVAQFHELVFDATAWQGKRLNDNSIIYTNNINKYIERKLYLLNSLHCFIAWNGIKNHFQYIYQLQNYADLKAAVNALASEMQAVLKLKYGFTQKELVKYTKTNIKRFTNSQIKDEVIRVGRDVQRKISASERFVTALQYALSHHLPHTNMTKAIALAFSNLDFQDHEVQIINDYIKNHGIATAVKKYTKIDDPKIIEEITKYALQQ